MGIVNFVIRRGAVYTWRRRIPVKINAGSTFLQLSLGTSCPWTARRVAGIVTSESDEIFEAMALDGLSREAAKKWLERVIRDELQRIVRRNRAQFDSKQPGYARHNAHEDKAMGHALRLLARDGICADVGEEERAELALEGVPDADVPRVEIYMQQAAGEALSEAVEAKIRKGVAEAAETSDLDAHQFIDSRRIYLRGRAAAYLAASRRSDPDFADALDLAERLSGKPNLVIPAQPASVPPVSQPEPRYDPAISAVAERMIYKKAAREKLTPKTAYQLRNTAALLSEATGVSDIRDLRQAHLAQFTEVMAALPPHYRKSAKEKNMPLRDIIASARARGATVGLSPATVNRNLTFIGQYIKQARSEGIIIDQLLDTQDLREVDPEDEQDKVPPFSLADLRKLFQAPIWTGCRGPRRRLLPGNLVLKDGLYWIPLIAAYSGARKEEISGLMGQDIAQEDGVWAFHIRFNEMRRIKNKPSRRKVPIHEHLVELGFLEYVKQAGKGQLFPELRRKSELAGLGESISYYWAELLKQQLGGSAEGKRFHSFRHYVTDQLRYEQQANELVRHHILGHSLKSEEDRRYGSRSPLGLLLPAINALPRLF